ncbi:MAG: hypothetical protein FWC43_14210 [Planctomycetaceae bacterium]|nr:hypothetical protein [Planctomycetaceae bacterium]
MKRRILFFALLGLIALGLLQTASAQQWYKGNFHMHSYWSDGNVFPEQAIDWYKDRGYNFLSLTDHNVVQANPDTWREVGKGNVTQALLDQYVERYGKDWVETKTEGDKTLVRLKTFPELIEKINVPDKFLVIPGHEQNVGVNGMQVHQCLINTVDSHPFLKGPTVVDSIRKNVNLLTQYGAETGRDVLFISNHNCWIYFDIFPQDLIDLPEVRFFELLNCQPVYQPHTEIWSFEKFWDVVNAFRLDAGNLPLYGVGNDDTHNYLQPGPKTRDLGNYWFMVRAQSLTTENILRAMYKGDFYVSSGVVLDDLQFDKASKTLSVKVKADPGVKYTIRFNGTKKGFDKTTKMVNDPAGEKKPAREFPVYSEEIGAIFKQIEGTEASYQMTDDDLFVRVTVVSDKEANYDDPTGYMPKLESAWSQPYYVK